MVDTFYRSRKNLTPSARLYLQKVRLSQKRRITAISGLELINPQYFTLNSVKNRVGNWGKTHLTHRSFVPHRPNTASLSLLYPYFHEKRIFSSTISDVYSWNTSYYFRRVESLVFPPCNKGNK